FHYYPRHPGWPEPIPTVPGVVYSRGQPRQSGRLRRKNQKVPAETCNINSVCADRMIPALTQAATQVWQNAPLDLLIFAFLMTDVSVSNNDSTITLPAADPLRIVSQLAEELGVRAAQVASAVELLDDGSTVPFIARYRKEATGGLDDTVLRNLEVRLL